MHNSNTQIQPQLALKSSKPKNLSKNIHMQESCRLLVTALIQSKLQSKSQNFQDDFFSIQKHKFVYPASLSLSIANLIESLEKFIQQNIHAQSQKPNQSKNADQTKQEDFLIKSSNIYVDTQPINQIEKIDSKEVKGSLIKEIFSKMYSVGHDQTVMEVFRDFDHIVLNCEQIQQTQHSETVNKDQSMHLKKRDQKYEEKSQAKTSIVDDKKQSDVIQKLGKNAKKKLKRQKIEEEKKKIQNFRSILHESINGYSQENASKSISHSSGQLLFLSKSSSQASQSSKAESLQENSSSFSSHKGSI